MLKNEEIKLICEKHKLTRKEVYEIRSQFTSMCLMSDEDEKSAAAGGGILGISDQAAPPREAPATHMDGPKEEGININYFIKCCSFLSGSLPHINRRILVAIGLDIESHSAVVNWHTFMELYCIFEAGKIEKEVLIRFWIKFFDQKLIGMVPREEHQNLLEELVRGNSLKKSNKTTRMFAIMFEKLMQRADVLTENFEIMDEKLAEAFRENKIDI